MENVKVERSHIMRRMALLISTIFPYSCCWKVKVEDKEIQTDGKFISFMNEEDFKSFFRNMPTEKDQPSEHISKV
jgi:hypothetical protein